MEAAVSIRRLQRMGVETHVEGDGGRGERTALRLVPIDGIGSEGALAVWLPSERFLWAGDWIQFDDRASLYASEVVRAAVRSRPLPVADVDALLAAQSPPGSGLIPRLP